MSAKIIASLRHEAEWLSKRLTDRDEAAFRVGGYQPQTGPTTYICPACWVLQAKRSTLDPIPAGREDAMGCDACGAEFIV